MAAGWLKHAMVQANTPTMSIIHRLKANIGGVVQKRSHKHVHASDVTKPNFCPRHYALLDMEIKSAGKEYISTAMQATFDIGNATADLVKEHWLGDTSIGNWLCASCGAQRTFCTKPKQGCKIVPTRCNWKYIEMVFESQEYGVSGSIDVMVDLGVLKVEATELKIMKTEDFDVLKFPLAEHTQRTELYLKLIADSNSAYKDKINLYEARVLYVSRGYGKKNVEHNEILPFKEYVVPRADEKILPLLQRAKQIKIFREEEFHPIPSGICTMPTDKYAVGCSTCKACFSGDYPAAQPELPPL
jgi:hypothetical protein